MSHLGYQRDGWPSDVEFKYNISGRFLSYLPIETSTGSELLNVLLEDLEKLEDVTGQGYGNCLNVRGQGYDDGSNVKGDELGVH
ncbi:hypothetical protein Btru_036603 [Bulinus truncatus]|nr:hypothetical protein Btru_036603 [Bulinus truncatus]